MKRKGNRAAIEVNTSLQNISRRAHQIPEIREQHCWSLMIPQAGVVGAQYPKTDPPEVISLEVASDGRRQPKKGGNSLRGTVHHCPMDKRSDTQVWVIVGVVNHTTVIGDDEGGCLVAGVSSLSQSKVLVNSRYCTQS